MDIDTLRARLRRPALCMEVGGFRAPESQQASWFGRVNLALPGEDWPRLQGEPMHALFQLDLTSLPFRPPRLEDVAFLTVFIAAGELPSSEPNGSGWCLRAYRSLEGLVALEQPKTGSPIAALPMRPRAVVEDFPCWDDVPAELSDAFDAATKKDRDALPNVSGFKLGGWPTLIQSEIYWAPMNAHPARPGFVFQVDSEDKAHWSWGDGGVGYFGRGTAPGHQDTWTLEWQCM